MNMLVICTNCEARLQLDEGKIPSQAFKVRCPKCQTSIDVASAPNANADAIPLPTEMTPSAPKPSLSFQRPLAAAPFKPAETANAESSNQNNPLASADVAKLLAAALRQNEPSLAKPNAHRRAIWDRRKALVCASPEHREALGNGLVGEDYEVFVAENTEEALGRMREDRIDVLLVDANFDPAEQGFAFITREVKLMRPSERRRLFLIYVTATSRTMDLHAAFLHNVNLVVSPDDLERLPDALEVSMRHYNELYRDFNRALDMPAI